MQKPHGVDPAVGRTIRVTKILNAVLMKGGETAFREELRSIRLEESVKNVKSDLTLSFDENLQSFMKKRAFRMRNQILNQTMNPMGVDLHEELITWSFSASLFACSCIPGIDLIEKESELDQKLTKAKYASNRRN
jgi:hypothetical protein